MKAIKGLFGGGKSKQKGDPGPNIMSAPSPGGAPEEANNKLAGSPAGGAGVPASKAQSPAKPVSPEEMDELLDGAISGAMDYLANEGLEVANLFRAVSTPRDVERTMEGIRRGETFDFIAVNDAPLTVGVLKACIAEKSETVFPTALLEELSEIIKVNRQDTSTRVSLLQNLLVDKAKQGAVSPLFLNLLGLLHLVNEHSSLNGTQISHLGAIFAEDFFDAKR